MIYLYNVGVTNEYLEDLKNPNQLLMDSLDLNGAGPRISPPATPAQRTHDRKTLSNNEVLLQTKSQKT